MGLSSIAGPIAADVAIDAAKLALRHAVKHQPVATPQFAGVLAALAGGQIGGVAVSHLKQHPPQFLKDMAAGIDEAGGRAYKSYMTKIVFPLANKAGVGTIGYEAEGANFSWAKQYQYLFSKGGADVPADEAIAAAKEGILHGSGELPQNFASLGVRFGVSAANRFAADTVASLASKGAVALVDKTKFYKKESQGQQQITNTFVSSFSYSVANELLNTIKLNYPTLGSVTTSNAASYGERIGENIAAGGRFYENLGPEVLGQSLGSVGALFATNPSEPIMDVASNVGFSAAVNAIKGAYSVLRSKATKPTYDPLGHSLHGAFADVSEAVNIAEEVGPELI